MKFSIQDIKEILFGGHVEDLELIYDNIDDLSRWDVHHEVVIKYKDKYYMLFYNRGATEYQDQGPDFGDIDGFVECEEVFPIEVTTIKYVSAEIARKALEQI